MRLFYLFLHKKINYMKKKFNPIRFIAIFCIVIGLMYIYKNSGLNDFFTKENIELYLKPFGIWIPFIYIFIFIFAMLFYVPASVFLIAIGSILDPVLGAIAGLIGCYLSSFILFLIARKLDPKKIEKKLGNSWSKFNKKIQEDGFFYIALIRSTSVFPFSLIGYASGITNIKVKDYIKGTIIGCIPQIIIYCYIIPMVLSGNITYDKILTIISITALWIALFGVAYNLHRKEKINALTIKME